MKPFPTLQQRMMDLYKRLEFYASQYRKNGELIAANCCETDAGFLIAEIEAYNADLVAALESNDVNPKTVIETDLFAGYREPTTVAEAIEAKALVEKSRPPITCQWQTADTVPPDKLLHVLTYYKGVGGVVLGRISNGRFYPDNSGGSLPFTHWMPVPSIHE